MEQRQPGDKQHGQDDRQEGRCVAVLADADIHPGGPGGKQAKAGEPARRKQTARLQSGGYQQNKGNGQRSQPPEAEGREGEGLQTAGDQQQQSPQPELVGERLLQPGQTGVIAHFG
jgi:hypothetical protein